MSHLDDARCVFIDGPIAVYLQQASRDELLSAWRRLGKLVEVAAGEHGMNPLPPPPPGVITQGSMPKERHGNMSWAPATLEELEKQMRGKGIV